MEIIIAIFIIWILWAWVKQKYKILRKKGEIISTIDNLEANSSLPLSPDLETKDIKQRTQSSSPKTLSSEPTWFADFEHFISECLKLSLSNAKIKAELENNPKLNKIFIQLRENNTISQEAQRPAKHGIETGPTSSVCTEPFKHHLIKNYPKNPRLSLDEAKNALSRKRHAEELKKHNDFIGVTLSKLKSQQFAVQEFGEILHSVGMEEILEQHFPSIARVQNKHQVTQVENHQSTENPRHKMIKAIAQRRGVFQLVHFTRVENVESILDHGIKPVSQLINDNSTFIRNDNMRLDNHLDAISMSISFPN